MVLKQELQCFFEAVCAVRVPLFLAKKRPVIWGPEEFPVEAHAGAPDKHLAITKCKSDIGGEKMQHAVCEISLHSTNESG